MNAQAPVVLVVEDEILLLMDISDELRYEGMTVYEAHNADEALAQLDAHNDINVLFTDIDMPGKLDGMMLARKVRDRWPPVKIIVTSGMTAPAAQSMPRGGIFLAKPYMCSNVIDAVNGISG